MQTRQFITTNPDHIEYAQGMLQVVVLGGVRLEGLDRLRVTLKIQVEHLALRHNLDLYNDTQVEKLIRKVAERLEVGTSVVAATLNDLTECLEQYRLAEIEKNASQLTGYEPKPLTQAEREKALAYLQAPGLIERTSQDIGNSGVAGEVTNRLLMYLVFTSRKRAQPLHVISLGSSGTGKTHLQEKVAELMPEEDCINMTSLSENAFYYFGRRELSHKLILIEDLDGLSGTGAKQGGGGAFYALRELQSKRKISKTVVHKNTRGETRTVHLKVEGPVSVAGCTTKERIYEDNANRSFLIYLDESPSQDGRIMDYQRAISAGNVDIKTEEKTRELLKNCQRLLQPITVRNPYAQQLHIPQEVFKPRRTNAHYLAFIEAVTFYHQYQREQQHDPQTGELYIETTLEDIAEANELMKEILLRKSDQLSGKCRDYFECLKAYLIETKASSFTNRSMSLAFRIPLATMKRYHMQLYNTNRIKLSGKKKGQAFQYEIVDTQEYAKLQLQISTVLDETVKRLAQSDRDQLSSSNAAQSKNELLKKKRNS